MNYFDLIISGSASIAALVISVYHLVKSGSRAINRIFSLSSLFCAALFILHTVYTISRDALSPDDFVRLMASLLLAFLTAALFLMLSYPFITGKSALVWMLLACSAGAAVIVLTALSDRIIAGAGGLRDIAPGPLFILYPVALAVYGGGTAAVQLVKSFTTKDRAFGSELLLLFLGTVVSFVAIIASGVFLSGIGRSLVSAEGVIILSLVFLIFLLHRTVDDIQFVDFKKFYETAVYWILLASILYVPVYIMLRYRAEYSLENRMPPPFTAFVIFIYLFLVFKFIRPRVEHFFQRRHRNFAEQMNNSFIQISEFQEKGASFSWNDYLKASMIKLLNNFDIDRGALYLLDRKKKTYTINFVSGEKESFPAMEAGSPLLLSLQAVQSTLIVSRFYTIEELLHYREESLKLLGAARIEMIMPFFNHQTEIIGVLLLGRMRNARYYAHGHVPVFELYRIQFQQQLLNITILEEAKEKQAIEHDKMVVTSIKKTVIPESMNQIEGIRVSSMHINNSAQGCDYFDSVELHDGRLLMFLSDSSYAGIDSAIVALQLYSAMHTPTKYITSPDRLLTIMNWLLTSSSLTTSTVPGIALIYSKNGEIQFSSAAADPLEVYNPRTNTFTSYTTRGLPLGERRDTVYEHGSFRSVPGNVGLIHSAGLLQSKNDKDQSYSIDAVRRIISTGRGDTPAMITRRLYEDYRSFIGSRRQVHDVSLIVFRV